jgi:cytochrome c
MKKYLIVLASVGCLIACNNSTSKPAAEEKKEEAPANDMSGNPDYQKGIALVGQNGCFSCHAVADKINGPSYQDVANKYAGAGDTIVPHLAKKIVEGGSGVWGTVPMIAHPQISEADAESMVKYVLLLKK